MKRCVDIAASGLGLLVLWPLLLVVAILVKLTSKGPVFFLQERMGRNFKPFKIIKFRTMVVDAPKKGGQITAGRDPRITTVGAFLRKTKIDELPQLINVFLGQMSLVGPRPEVPKYVDMFRESYSELLSIRPGITDLASLKYRNESELLGKADDPERAYVDKILPDKIELGRQYIRQSSFLFDMKLIFKTVMRMPL